MGDGRNHKKKLIDPVKGEQREFDLLLNWDCVEADFQREYGINLAEEMENMTYRRMIVLLNNLSGESATAHRMKAEQKDGPKRGCIEDIL